MTAAGGRATVAGARALTPAQLKLTPPRMINIKSTMTHGRAAGLPLEEQGAIATPRGDSITEVAAPVPVPIEAALRAVIDAMPPPRSATAR
jgi:hypothetical protein